MIRAFVAVPVEGEIAEDLAAQACRIPGGRKVPRENLHLTLAFLGDQPETALAELDTELSALRLTTFDVTLGGFDLFGPRDGIVALTVAPSDALTALHTDVARAARRAGITLERRRFRPHVTIARLKGGGGPEVQRFLLREPLLPKLPVTGFALYRSILRPDGPAYDVLAEYPFLPA